MSIFQFLLTYDFKRHWKQIVCDLIYVHNEYKIQPVQVEFRLPQELDQRPEILDDPNTYTPAVINPNHDHRMKPSETGFLYRRLPLACLRRDPLVRIIPPQIPFKTYEVLDQINQQLSASLTELDLINMTHESLEGEVLIYAKPTSHVWVGFRDIVVDDGAPRLKLFPDEELNVWTDIFQLGVGPHPDEITGAANGRNETGWVLYEDFSFGDIEAIEPLATELQQNTRIFVQSNLPNYDDQWLYYYRYHPSEILELFSEDLPYLTITDMVVNSDVLREYLRLMLGINILPEDVYFDDYALDNDLTTLTLRFREGSLAWQPGSIEIPVVFNILEPWARLSDEQTVRTNGDGNYRVYTNQLEPS